MLNQSSNQSSFSYNQSHHNINNNKQSNLMYMNSPELNTF